VGDEAPVPDRAQQRAQLLSQCLCRIATRELLAERAVAEELGEELEYVEPPPEDDDMEKEGETMTEDQMLEQLRSAAEVPARVDMQQQEPEEPPGASRSVYFGANNVGDVEFDQPDLATAI